MHSSSGMGQRLKIWDKSWTYLLARILRRGSHFQGSGSCTRCCCLLAWNFPFSLRSAIVSSETCLLGASVPIDWSTHKHNNNCSAWLLSALTSKPVHKVCKNRALRLVMPTLFTADASPNYPQRHQAAPGAISSAKSTISMCAIFCSWKKK